MRKQYSGIFRQWIEELAALPVSYFCNYCLLAAAGIAFEYAVFLMRYGNWLPAYGTQSLIVASVQVTILQTAAEYFRAEGPAGFALRLAAAAAHFAFFTALILLQLDVRIPTGQFCAMLGVLFWIVAITNAVNFIDGLDGLAVGVSGISTASLLVIALMVGERNVAILLAALLGACIGFIPYNLNPAKIFMGDTGSMLLGGGTVAMAMLLRQPFHQAVVFGGSWNMPAIRT